MESEKNLVLSVYDFDKTIYNGETSTNFYIYLIKRNPLYLLFFPIQIIYMLLYAFNLIKLKVLKQNFFFFLKFVKKEKLDKQLKNFWKLEKKNVHHWFYSEFEKNKKEGHYMICISASPDFIMQNFAKTLGFDLVMATKFKKNPDGSLKVEIDGENCKKDEKVKRLNLWAEENSYSYEMKNFYSDSLSDKALYDLAKNKFFIDKKGNLLDGLPMKKTFIDKIFWK